MENNDAFRENLAKKALPRRDFFEVPIDSGYSKSVHGFGASATIACASAKWCFESWSNPLSMSEYFSYKSLCEESTLGLDKPLFGRTEVGARTRYAFVLSLPVIVTAA